MKTAVEVFEWLNKKNYQTEYGEQELKMYFDVDMPRILNEFAKEQLSEQHRKIEVLRNLLEESGELLNLLLSKMGCGTQDSSLKSDHEDYGGVDLLVRIKQTLKTN